MRPDRPNNASTRRRVMKKSVRFVFLFTAAIILLAGITFGQTLQKGNVIGVHVATIALEPGVTMEQFISFFTNKYIPEFEKNRIGWKAYFVKSIRGDIKNGVGLVIVIKSEKDWERYYNADRSYSELGNSANEKLKPILEELKKFGTFTTSYTDWVIQ
jgi:hypothetical protein